MTTKLTNGESVKARKAARDRAWKAGHPEYVNGYQRAYDLKHPEKKQARNRRYRLRHPEKIAVSKLAWKLRNQEKVKANDRAYYIKHRKERIDRATAWWKANPDKVREKNKLWQRKQRAKNPEHSRTLVRKWRQLNPEKWREANRTARHRRRARLKANTVARFTRTQWLAKVASYDGRCAYCDIGLYEHMDHIIPLSRGGPHSLANVVPACKSCNEKKGVQIWTPRPERGTLTTT